MKPGDILASTWGYDATIVSFYIVNRRTKHFVELFKLKKESEGGMFPWVRPYKNELGHVQVVGEKFKKKAYDEHVYINEYQCAYVWDGKDIQEDWSR